MGANNFDCKFCKTGRIIKKSDGKYIWRECVICKCCFSIMRLYRVYA